MISKVPASSPELNLIGVLRLFGVDRATDQTLQASTVAQLNREALLSLCAVLEVGFQARLLSDIPGGLRADFMEALDQEFGDKRRGLLVGMFVNRLHGDAYELNVEENVGFADYASFVAFARDLYDARKIRRLRNALRENAPEELARVLMVSKWLWPWHRLPVYSLLARVNERIARRLDGNREIMELRESISEIANYIYDFYPMLVVESEDRYFQSMLWHYVAPRLIYVIEGSSLMDLTERPGHEGDRLARFLRELLEARGRGGDEREEQDALVKIEGAYRALEELRSAEAYFAQPLVRAIIGRRDTDDVPAGA